jgi:hypothetical protein
MGDKSFRVDSWIHAKVDPDVNMAGLAKSVLAKTYLKNGVI